MHSGLAPDILLPGVKSRGITKLKKKIVAEFLMVIYWKSPETHAQKMWVQHPHNEVPCSRRKNKKDLHQHNQ